MAKGDETLRIKAGRWTVRVGAPGDAADALSLRARVFRDGASDRDPFDARARHLTISDGAVAACARLRLGDPRQGYAAGFYGLAGFAAAFPRALEVGRVCLAPEVRDPDLPRLILATLARIVTAEGAAALFGCASFPADGMGLGAVAARVAPAAWRPGRIARETAPLAGPPGPVPPLLRGYLALGASVSDHAVIDRDLGTRHVFAALPVAAIPPGRARRLTGMLDTV
ncbi:MAG: GNAT family N-acyltransferase [Pseudomonadota bacterium]